MKVEIEIYFKDLCARKQEEIKEELKEEGLDIRDMDWDYTPMETVFIEEE